MIYGFSKPWNPVFIHFIIPKYFKKYKKHHGDILEKYYVHNSTFRKSKWLTIFEKTGTEHDEDPSNNFLEILNMGPISTGEHEMIFCEYDFLLIHITFG